MVRHVESEIINSALVGLLKRHIRIMERITGMILTFPSNMMIMSWTIFEPSQHSVAATVYHVVMYDCVTRMVRFVMLRKK